jgi:hypothetical protein
MKKTYFIKIYNLVQFLILFVLLTAILSPLLKFLELSWQKLDKSIPFFTQVISGIDTGIKMLNLENVFIPTLLVIIILQEIVKRLTKDSLFNLGKSIVGTLQFRRFLKQHQKVIKNDIDSETHSENLTISKFNHAVNKCVLDLSREELKLFVKVPKEAQSQKILKEHEEQIKEHISSLYPEYIISTFERNKFNLWLVGTKKK